MVTSKRCSWGFRGAALAICLAVPAPARATLDLQGTRSIAMGGALRASPTGESAILLNPAGMSLMRQYIVSGLYQFRVSDEASLVNATVMDSSTNRVAAGLFYSFSHASPTKVLALPGGQAFDLAETIVTHEAGLALAYPFGTYLHIGLLTRYVNISVEQPESTPLAARREDIDTVTMDFGAIVSPIESLRIAVVGYNVVPVDGYEFPIQLGLGIAYTFGSSFMAEFDTVLDFSREETVAASYHGGVELFMASLLAIRGGFQHDTVREASYASGGIGFITRTVGVDLAVRQMVDGGAETLLAVSIRMFVQ